MSLLPPLPEVKTIPPGPSAPIGINLNLGNSLLSTPTVPAPVPMPMAPPQVIDEDKRVTVWNRRLKRKIAGNAAPMGRNLADYLKRNPDCELYNGQDAHVSPEEKKAIIAAQKRIAIWNKTTRRRISGRERSVPLAPPLAAADSAAAPGNAAPKEAKLAEYLRKHPECEVYTGQDRGMPLCPPSTKPVSVGLPRAPMTMGAPGGAPLLPPHSSGMVLAAGTVPAAVPAPRPEIEGDSWGGMLPGGSEAIPIMGRGEGEGMTPTEFSIADMYGSEDMAIAGSLGKMSAHSLEGMLQGMSLQEIDTLMSPGSFPMQGNSLGFGGDLFGESAPDSSDGAPTGNGSASMMVPMSSAQRIKRDRAFSIGSLTGSLNGRARSSSLGSQAGSMLAHPSQRMRQGPGPGSLGRADLTSGPVENFLGASPDLNLFDTTGLGMSPGTHV